MLFYILCTILALICGIVVDMLFLDTGISQKLLNVIFHKSSTRTDYPRDTVILFQLSRGPYAPSLSPFPLKLETYLRVAKIPYENDLSNKMSKKGKTPWIMYNGESVADSQFCIDYLNKKLDIDLNSHLTESEKGIARAFQKMTEENLYWAIASWRWYIDKTKAIKQLISVPSFVVWYVGRMVKKSTWGHGIGRHTPCEIKEISLKDLSALSNFLGEKNYLMGDKISEVDCAIFGMLAQILYHSPGSPHLKFVTESCQNLVDYVERIKQEVWPDWNENITRPPTK
ncbi:unnamed protein product [Owenia fusiformis]|uniref:Uncharacterized protein n=1 Tax=Owenia fusiformis TaxID=6347 RepID=A0A8J1T4X7_OWEFU|nr:unnamed protein product [Owenia fusiformis]